MTWIQTSTGRKIDFLNPDPKEIDIVDIAIHLSRIPRFTGAALVGRNISVAEHCVLVSERCSPENALVGLAHDFPEAYTGDINRPLKQLLGQAIKDIEERLWNAMAIKWNLPKTMPEEVKVVDERMLFTEREQCLDCHVEWSWKAEPYDDVLIACADQHTAYCNLLDRWYELTL